MDLPYFYISLSYTEVYWRCLQLCRELAQSLVEIVHLRQDADDCYYDKDVGRRMSELVIPPQAQLKGNSKCLDRHDRDRSDCRTYGYIDEGILLSIYRRNLVYHKRRKYDDRNAVQ